MRAFAFFFGAAVLAGSIPRPRMPVGPPLVCLATLLVLLYCIVRSICTIQYVHTFIVGFSLTLFFFSPTQPAPKYMVDNERNTFNAAPDKGILNGPVTGPIKMSSLKAKAHVKRLQRREETGEFWIDEIQHGQVL